MKLMQIHDYLFVHESSVELKVEPISNRRFVIMVTLGIVVITLARLFLAA